MSKRSMRLVPVALAIALSFGLAQAQTTGTTPSTTPSTGSSATAGQSAPAVQPGAGTRKSDTRKGEKLARGDRKFMEKAAGGGMAEVQDAQLASTKATDPAVKSFASKLLEDHTAANDELVRLANSKGVELPAGPPRAKRREAEKLGKDTGAKFDQQYVKAEIKDHEKDIKEFEKASSKVKDPDLKAWIDKTLPHLREHLAMAQKLPEAGGKGNSAAMGNRGAKPSSDMGTTPGGAATGTNTGRKTGS